MLLSYFLPFLFCYCHQKKDKYKVTTGDTVNEKCYSLFDALRASLRRFVPKKEMEFLIFSYRLPMFLAFDCNHLIYIQYP